MTRLTEDMVIARTKVSNLSLIKQFNCWGCELTDISILKRMRGAEVVSLSVNKIKSLQPFAECEKLQELYVRNNEIQDINEIAHLKNLPNLKFLWLGENPCCKKLGTNYRAAVLRTLPNLKKLDNIDVTEEEVNDALRSAGGDRPGAQEKDSKEDAHGQHQIRPQVQHQHQQQQASQRRSHQILPQVQCQQQQVSQRGSHQILPQVQSQQQLQHQIPLQVQYQHQQHQASQRRSHQILPQVQSQQQLQHQIPPQVQYQHQQHQVSQRRSHQILPQVQSQQQLQHQIPPQVQYKHQHHQASQRGSHQILPQVQFQQHQASQRRSHQISLQVQYQHQQHQASQRGSHQILPQVQSQQQLQHQIPLQVQYQHQQHQASQRGSHQILPQVQFQQHQASQRGSNQIPSQVQSQQHQASQRRSHQSQHTLHSSGRGPSSSLTKEKQIYPTSPKYNQNTREHRMSLPQADVRAPFMWEHYQSERPHHPPNYRQNQTDLTEWDEHPYALHHNPYGSSAALHHTPRQPPYHNGYARESGECEESLSSRPRRSGIQPQSVISAAISQYAPVHRRPVSRSSNLLSAALCLVKELDYESLEILEHSVCSRILELSNE